LIVYRNVVFLRGNHSGNHSGVVSVSSHVCTNFLVLYYPVAFDMYLLDSCSFKYRESEKRVHISVYLNS